LNQPKKAINFKPYPILHSLLKRTKLLTNFLDFTKLIPIHLMRNNLLAACCLFLMLTLNYHCQDTSKTEQKKGDKKSIFSLIKDTGIDFTNPLTQTTKFSTFDYQYFQNGGGVAIADFDQDGLEDIFFTSNMKGDRIYKNEGDFKFKDVTSVAGADGFGHNIENSWSTGVTIADINEDGYPDIYICKSGNAKSGEATENVLYINNKDFTFVERSEMYGLNDAGHSTQAVFFDADRDGDLDAYILNHSISFGNGGKAFMIDQDPQEARPHSGSFYINENQKFRDITLESGLSTFGYGLGVVASDLNNDGWTDLFVANDFSRPDRMYINQTGKNNSNGKIKFIDEIRTSVGHTSFYSMGCDAADINNDGLLDISVVDMAPANNFRSKTLMPSMSTKDFYMMTRDFEYVHQYMFNSLQINHGDQRFSEIAKIAGVHKTDWSWATLLADYDNDGWKDMFVSNGYRYNKMDNDFSIGFKKMIASYQGKSIPENVKSEWINKPPSYKLKNYLFQNVEGHKFKNTSQEWGITKETFSNGAAYGDLDNDGDLDLVINNIDDVADIYKNNTTKNYLQVDLVKDGKNNLSQSLNAKVTIFYNDQHQYQELTLTRGFQSACSDVLQFGLNDLSKVDSLWIIWPNQSSQVITNIKANQRIVVDQKNATKNKPTIKKNFTHFASVKNQGLDFIHKENEYNDFDKELLLPHQNSRFGPFASTGDVNNDGRDDLFVGGASGQSGKLYLQKSNGRFAVANSQPWSKDRASEDMKSVFFDIDNDQDLDLYVVSGSNEFVANHPNYQDRIYINDGHGNFKKDVSALPVLTASGSCVVVIDYDQDGWQDLFVGGRMKPQMYPYASASFLLRNNKGKLEKVINEDNDLFQNLGMVTDAIVIDLNEDQRMDLVIVGEWMPITLLNNTQNGFEDITPANLKSASGWWNSIKSGDFNEDGKMDFVVGNLGLNYKYKASEEEPFQIYANDFDKSGNLDIVLGYFNEGKQYPLRGRECSSEQMPFIKDKFPTFEGFANASLNDVYGEALTKSFQLKVTNFANSVLLNLGGEEFEIKKLPFEAQYSCVNDIIVRDFNNDQKLDLLIAGNMFAVEPETPRNDGGVGMLLLGDGQGAFDPLSLKKSGFYLPQDIKNLATCKVGDRTLIIATANDGPLIIHEWNSFEGVIE